MRGTRASATAGLALMLLSFAYVTSFCHAVGTLRRAGVPSEGLLEALGRSALFTDAASFFAALSDGAGAEVTPSLRRRVRGLMRDAKAFATTSGVNDVMFKAVRCEARRSPIDDVVRFVASAWPAERDLVSANTASSPNDPLTRALFQLTLSLFVAHALVLRMLEAEHVPASIVRDVLERSPLLNRLQRALAAAYVGRLSVRNYASPSSTVRVLHDELGQLRASLSSLKIRSTLPRAMARLTQACIDDGLEAADFFAVYHVTDPPEQSPEKRRALADNVEHVNSGRVGFFTSAGMDFVMGKREGAYLHDLDGKISLFDLHCNGGVFNLGHRHPEIARALRDALDTLDIGNHHLLSAHRGALARRLSDLLPGDISRVVFGVSGGEAIDLAIKLARGATKRSKILFARGGYHGHTGFAVFAGDPRFYDDFAERPAHYAEVERGSVSSLREKLDSDTAAVLYETVPASVGFPIPPPGFYEEVRSACDEVGALLVIDEVQSGWGRSGKLWAIEHYDVVPDIVVLGKGMSAGHYPMSAVCYRPHLAPFLTRDSFRHQSTMGGAELGCVVVQKQLDILTTPAFASHVQSLALAFAEELSFLMARHPEVIVGIRQLGLLMGIVYATPEYGPLMTRCAYDEGLLLVFAGLDPSVSQLLPPLTMSLQEVSEVVEKLDRALLRARELHRLMQRFARGG
jgi:putrescine aminotransferase